MKKKLLFLWILIFCSQFAIGQNSSIHAANTYCFTTLEIVFYLLNFLLLIGYIKSLSTRYFHPKNKLHIANNRWMLFFLIYFITEYHSERLEFISEIRISSMTFISTIHLIGIYFLNEFIIQLFPSKRIEKQFSFLNKLIIYSGVCILILDFFTSHLPIHILSFLPKNMILFFGIYVVYSIYMNLSKNRNWIHLFLGGLVMVFFTSIHMCLIFSNPIINLEPNDKLPILIFLQIGMIGGVLFLDLFFSAENLKKFNQAVRLISLLKNKRLEDTSNIFDWLKLNKKKADEKLRIEGIPFPIYFWISGISKEKNRNLVDELKEIKTEYIDKLDNLKEEDLIEMQTPKMAKAVYFSQSKMRRDLTPFNLSPIEFLDLYRAEKFLLKIINPDTLSLFLETKKGISVDT